MPFSACRPAAAAPAVEPHTAMQVQVVGGISRIWRGLLGSAALLLALGMTAPATFAQTQAPASEGGAALVPAPSHAFVQALVGALAEDEAIAAWYRDTGHARVWTRPEDAARREALFSALDGVRDHGLPEARYGAAALRKAAQDLRTEGDLGRLEAAMMRAWVTWADDMTSGMLDPATIDRTIVREIRREEPRALIEAIMGDEPMRAVTAMLPRSAVYAELMRARLDLQQVAASGAWGAEVAGGKLAPGDKGPRVVALRDRLIAMGWLAPTHAASYDRGLEQAVLAFQTAHGLPADGVAGETTLKEINRPPEARLQALTVAMERERWLEIDRSGRMIWVNLPDFSARIVDDGRATFRTRSVIGREEMDRRTPEFSDMMDHMVVNPSWGVPRSIIVGEYLPLLQRNPGAVSQFQIIDRNGRVVPRGSVNFAKYTARSFPFSMRQPPGDSNALGKVKFMFPNKYNIYLHDTPSKSLFGNDRRAYSHGCIRLADPFDFAHALFATQSPEIETEFNRMLNSGRETPVKLQVKVPIHLVYFTAYPEGKGRMGYRRDVYDRDARLWAAMSEAGVELLTLSH